MAETDGMPCDGSGRTGVPLIEVDDESLCVDCAEKTGADADVVAMLRLLTHIAETPGGGD